MSEVDPDQREEQELLDPVERKVPFFLRIELYIPLILIAGISLAVLLYAQGMIGAGWTLGDKKGTVVGAFIDVEAPVILYVSRTSQSYMARVGGNHEVLIRPWRDYFKEHKRAYKEVSDPAALADYKDRVIVVPSATSLTEAERKALVEHHKKGGSLLATGPLGARDGAGNWVGWGLMEQLFGARVADEVDPGAEKNFLVMSAGVPLTTAFPNGARVWVGKAPERALRIEGAGQGAARYLDWARTPDGKKPVVVFGEKDKGRWALFGFSENSWEAAPTGIRMLADGTIEWLQRRPKAVVSAWPGGYRAAHIVTMNVDEPVENALGLASTLDTLKIKGTFFVLADAVAKAPGTIKAISVAHEIAYHGDASQGFKGQAKGDQAGRIKAMQQKLAVSLRPDERIQGFRAPGESYDTKTEEVLQEAGLRYHAVDPNRSDGRLPLFAKVNRMVPRDDLVVMARTQADDIVHLQRQDASLNDIISLMRGELGLVIEEGALGMLSIHSRNYAKDSIMAQAVPTYLLSLAEARSQVWLATGAEVADWWRKRENVRVTLSKVGQRYELEVSNTGEPAVEGATIDIYHPHASKVVVTSTKAWLPEATVRRVDEFRSQVVFGSLPKGHHGYTLVFE
jgi:peptidoglycan/xylan/chitin deacetylase (PgdA/CDA1 family)